MRTAVEKLTYPMKQAVSLVKELEWRQAQQTTARIRLL